MNNVTPISDQCLVVGCPGSAFIHTKASSGKWFRLCELHYHMLEIIEGRA